MHVGAFALSWGWNPVVFFIALAVSLLVAWRLKKMLVIWVIPALVLYYGLDWALPWSWLFKTIFWLAVLAAVLTAVGPSATKFAKFPLKWVTALVVFILILSGIVGAWNGIADLVNGDGHAPTASPTTSMPSATPLVQASCPTAFVQKDETDPALARFIKGGVDSATAKESSQKILAAAGHNAAYLNLLAKDAFNLPNVPATADMLTPDGTCLSEAGRQVDHDLGVVMSASGQQFSDAPANGYNSGITSRGIPVIDPNPGVSGPKKAVLYTLPNGSKVYIMVRCGNPVFIRPPQNVPHGCTDNGGCTPPPSGCPWPLTNGKCVQPKNPNQDPARQHHVPTRVTGKNPPVTSGPSSPAVSKPTGTYTAPASPTPTPSPRPTPAPSPESGAPSPSAPQTTCIPAPGMTSC